MAVEHNIKSEIYISFNQKSHSNSKKITAQKQQPVMRDLHLSSQPFPKINVIYKGGM